MGGLGNDERVFAFESRPRTGESLNEQGGRRQSADGVDEVGLGAGYAGLRRANSTKLWATTADQM